MGSYFEQKDTETAAETRFDKGFPKILPAIKSGNARPSGGGLDKFDNNSSSIGENMRFVN